MGANDMPTAEVVVDELLVRDLLAAQHPDLADRPLRLLANGWDNVLFRLGDDFVVRLPIPAPVRQGRPTAAFPWAWSVVPWFEGRSGLEEPPIDPIATAEVLGGFLAALHRPAPPEAPRNPYRGVPLAEREVQFRANLAALGDSIDGDRIAGLWDDLTAAPSWDGPALWLHGDVHPGNLVVRDGQVVAVVDLGDLCAGDRVSDLVVAWMLFDGPSRERFRVAAGAERTIDDASWTRARAWALALGLVIKANSADSPAYAAFADRTITAVLADA